MVEHIPAEPRAGMIIEIKVRPATFRVRVAREDWDSWSYEERNKWCEDMAQEFDKLHFDNCVVTP